jgi:sec-independent protein translocase protein TatB
VFGFSLSELIVVIVVALVVIGPKDLPKMLRKLGQYAGKLRRMASELRAQSGIDEALRTEGLSDDIAEIRKLARGELDAVQRAAVDVSSPAASPAASTYSDDFYVVRDREYPRDGADAYGALPDNAIVYAEGLPKSPLARDPLYMLGDPNGVVPEPPPPPVFGDDLAADGTSADADANGDAAPTGPTVKGEPAPDDAAPTGPTVKGGPPTDPSEAETQEPPAVAARSESGAQ